MPEYRCVFTALLMALLAETNKPADLPLYGCHDAYGRTDVSEFDQLAEEISSCTVCDSHGLEVGHVPPMERGTGTQVLVIGRDPGRTEVKTAEAFSGPAGRRLMGWLRDAGLGSTREEILSRCYLTSLCKCRIVRTGELQQAIRNCFPFLERQIQVVQPTVCITLGMDPLRTLFHHAGPLEAVVGKAFFEPDLGLPLVPLFPPQCKIIPYPHPSGLSRWLNSQQHKQALENAIALTAERIQ